MLLLRAFALSNPKKHKIKLIFAGGGEFSKKEKDEIIHLALTNYVAHVKINDDKLWDLYNNAIAVLVPSLAEGFSLPLVEALSADTPVICSDISVHREVAGCYAHLVSPINYSDWADVLSSPESLRKPSSKLGAKRYEQQLTYFSRDRMIQEHVEAYSA